MQDAPGNWGGNLILSTTTVNTNSGSTAGQLTDRLTLHGNGTASFTGSVSLMESSSTLTAAGNTVLGTTGADTLLVNAASTFAAPLTAEAAVMITAGNSFRALGSVTFGTDSSNTVTVSSPTTFGPAATLTTNGILVANAAADFNALITANNAVTIAGTLTAGGNTVIGATSSQLLTVNAAPTFHSPTTFTSTAPITANAAIAATNAVTVKGLLTATGNTALGIDNSQTLTVNASANFNAPIVFSANAPVTAGSNMSIGSNSSQALMVQASSTFSAPVVANAAVTIAAGNALSALGNATIGSSNANSLMVNANATFAGSATFSQAFQLYSNSSSPSSGVVLGFQRQNSAAAVGSGFTLGSILFSGYDGVVQGPTAQIRSVFTVWPRLVSMFIKPFDHFMSVEGHSDCSLLSAVPMIAKCQSAKNLHLMVQSQLCCSLHIYLMLVVRAQPLFGCSTHASDSCITCVHAYICVSVHNYSTTYKVYLDLCLTVLSYLHGQ